MNWNLLSSRARLVIRASFVGVGLFISEYGPHLLSSGQLNAGPFECHQPSGVWLTGRYPDYTSTMSRSDCRISMSPPCFFSLLRNASDTAIPSSDAIRWMSRCGPFDYAQGRLCDPGPPLQTRLITPATMLASEHSNPWPIAIRKISGLTAFTRVAAEHPLFTWLRTICYLLIRTFTFRPVG